MKRISISGILKAVNGTLIGAPYQTGIFVRRVVTDSRTVEAGDLYIPIVGERFDGHDFCHDAFKKGAVLSFTAKNIEPAANETYILVKDTRIALGALAAWYRSLFDIPVIGITGSVGKTSTKEMLAAILSTRYQVHKTSGNYNNDIGLPLTLLELESEHDAAVIELGMNHFGEIDYLADILKPTMGIIVNIGVSHIEYLGSRDGILKAKTEMLPHIQKGGLIILNGDDDRLKSVSEVHGLRKRYYGNGDDADCVRINHRITDNGGQTMTASSSKGIYHITVAYPGEHILHNALGCIIAAENLGLSIREIEKGISSYKPAGMRLNAYHLKKGITVLDDAYNASVDSMISALKTVEAMKGRYKKTAAVLGSMFEMGDYAEEGHRQVGRFISETAVDLLLTVGDEAAWISDEAVKAGFNSRHVKHFPKQEMLLDAIEAMMEPETLVLLKASRGMHLEKTRDFLIESFEEKR